MMTKDQLLMLWYGMMENYGGLPLILKASRMYQAKGSLQILYLLQTTGVLISSLAFDLWLEQLCSFHFSAH